MSQFITLSRDTHSTLRLPTRTPSIGTTAVEIASLSEQGLMSYDPGFARTAACTSHITYTDGETGILLYRGYPIEQLAAHSDFLEVAHLLMHGELPNRSEKQVLIQAIQTQGCPPSYLNEVVSSFEATSHPMAIMIGLMARLAAHDETTFNSPEVTQRITMAQQVLAYIPALVAIVYRHSIKQTFTYPEKREDYARDFLHMMFYSKDTGSTLNPVLPRALDRIFILHADHEQNASTTALRVAGATGTNLYACISAAMATLWGPAHGGANEACLKMLMEIGDSSRIHHYLKRAKDRNDPFRLMGFGHRVYKTCDPRAAIIRQTYHEVLTALEIKDTPLFQLALKLEKIASEDEYFIQRKLYPNVDFYSGIILNALGIPTPFFTVMFALARTAGWIAHWLEMMQDPERTLVRPRQLYQGSTQREYVRK